jgi:hypothetical protein
MKPRELFSDIYIRSHANMPSCASYNPLSLPKIKYGKISSSNIGDMFTEIEYHSIGVPGPATYSPKVTPSKIVTVHV